MSKEKPKEQEQQAQQPAAEATAAVPDVSPSNTTTTVSDKSPSDIESPVILRAKSREELGKQFDELKAKHDGCTLAAGCVTHDRSDKTYYLRVDIIKTK